MQTTVAVIGGGIAGMQTAISLRELGIQSFIIEKKDILGGKLNRWNDIFPTRQKAETIVESLVSQIGQIPVFYNSEVLNIEREASKIFYITLNGDRVLKADAIVIASGFSIFDARKKQEYGYGVYQNVFSSEDFEKMLKADKIVTSFGNKPESVAFVHCVGSRDEKVGNRHCSKVCCITAVKQAMEFKEIYPNADVYSFYMDLRMFDRYFEDIYYKAQIESGVNFVRGRLCQVSEAENLKLRVRVEDTLISKTLNLDLDMIVLMSGIESNKNTLNLAKKLDVKIARDGFLSPKDDILYPNLTIAESVFVVGTCKGAKTIPEVISDAKSAALQIKASLGDKKYYHSEKLTQNQYDRFRI